MKTITCSKCGNNIKLYKTQGSYSNTLNGLLNSILAANGELFVCATCTVAQDPRALEVFKNLASNIRKDVKHLEYAAGAKSEREMAKELQRNFKPYSLRWYLSNHDRLVKIYTIDYPKFIQAKRNVHPSFEVTVNLLRGGRNDHELTEELHRAYNVPLTAESYAAVLEYVRNGSVFESIEKQLYVAAQKFEEAYEAAPLGKLGGLEMAYGYFRGFVRRYYTLRVGIKNFTMNKPSHVESIKELINDIDAKWNFKSIEKEEYLRQSAEFEAETEGTKESLAIDESTNDLLTTIREINKNGGHICKRTDMLFAAYGLKPYISRARELITSNGDPLISLEAQMRTHVAKFAEASPEKLVILTRELEGYAHRAERITKQLDFFGYDTNLIQSRLSHIKDLSNVAVTRTELETILGGSLTGTLFENY